MCVCVLVVVVVDVVDGKSRLWCVYRGRSCIYIHAFEPFAWATGSGEVPTNQERTFFPSRLCCVCFSRKRKNLGRLSQERERQNNKKDHHHHQRKKKRDVNVNLATLTRERKRVEPKYLLEFLLPRWENFVRCGDCFCHYPPPPNHLTLERKRDNMWNVRFISAPNGNWDRTFNNERAPKICRTRN